MDCINYLIVGSGPSGVAAARVLEDFGVCLLDAADHPKAVFSPNSLAEALSQGEVTALLGGQFEMLGNVVKKDTFHTKLRSPGLSYVMQGNPLYIGASTGNGISVAGSFAAGGMSNAWGAQLLRYTQADLDQLGDWPISISALEPFYADLEQHIGISGCADDMHAFLGNCETLLPPVPLVPSAEYLLKNYNNKRDVDKTFKLGRARLGVLSVTKNGYPPHSFGETEFFSTENSSVYTARRTLQELRNRNKITYIGNHELISYEEFESEVVVKTRDRTTGSIYSLKARHLLLACGAAQTAQLVLKSNQTSYGKALPFIDHPPTLIPFFLPKMFGCRLPDKSYPIQLVASNDSSTREMISFYYPGGMLWSDLISEIPLPLNSSAFLLRNLLGGMLVAQIWVASKAKNGNRLRLDENNRINVTYDERQSYETAPGLIKFMRKLGAFTLERFISSSPPGWGFHYAGCLPMRARPNEFETFVDGRLWNSKRVRVVDGAVLPSLPSKNHSMTIMANAARIATETLKCAY